MKNQWAFWLFIVGVVVVVLFAFNYQGRHEVVSLSEIFPEQQDPSPDYEYVFVDESGEAPGAEAVTENASAGAGELAQAETPMTADTSAEEISQTAESAAPVQTGSSSGVQAAASAAAPVLDKEAAFTIQVSSFRSKSTAEKALDDIKAAGYPAYIARKDLGAKGVWHRIYVGAFDNREAANSFLSKVKKDYEGSFIISP